MIEKPAPSHPSTPRRSRRVRFAAQSAMLLIAVTLSAVVAGAVADRHVIRLDVTATREHSLSPRTRAILTNLERPVEIVVVADDRMLDRRARERVHDVLDAFEHDSPLISVTKINPVTDAGREKFDALRGEIATLYKDETSRRREVVRRTGENLPDLATKLDAFSDALLALREPLTKADDPLAAQIETVAAVARLQARPLAPLARQAADATSPGNGDTGDTGIGEASGSPEMRMNPRELGAAQAALLSALVSLRDQLVGFTKELVQVSASADPGSELAGAWRSAIQLAESIRDEVARQTDALDRLGVSEADLVRGILESADAVLVLSEGRSTAIAFSSLFPSTDRIDGAGGSARELRFVGEELIATAIASLDRPTTPIVVLTHNLSGRLLDEAGAAASAQARSVIGAMLDRLRLRGVTLAEWPAGLRASRPSLASLMRTPPFVDGRDARPTQSQTGAARTWDRPVVWLCFGTEGASSEAAARFDAYSQAVQSLIDGGESMLISLAPSSRPASGADDPIARSLRSVGVLADTGRPLVRRIQFAAGPGYDLSYTFQSGVSGTPIAEALSALPTLLTWLTPVRAVNSEPHDRDPWRITPILQIESGDDVWAEGEWRGFASAPDDQPWASPTPITPDPRFDDVAGPWPIAVAVEATGAITRTADPGDTLHGDPGHPDELAQPEMFNNSRQRFVIVGSPGWFFDRLAARMTTIEGRSVQATPGNLSLLEASIYWLALQDDMIAPGAVTSDTPRIAAMSDATLAALRWTIILALPAGTLILGAALRLTLLR